jgi:hypothetical protein
MDLAGYRETGFFPFSLFPFPGTLIQFPENIFIISKYHYIKISHLNKKPDYEKNNSTIYPDLHFVHDYRGFSPVTFLALGENAGNSGSDYAQSVTADSLGNSYVTGLFSTSVSFDASHTYFSNGSADIYVEKYDPAGNVVWATTAGGNDYDLANSVAVDKEGNVFITGYFKSPTLTFGSTTLVNAGGFRYDLFLVKYDPAGNVLWA